ncbi:MAG: hypothetical protein ACYST5_22700, partial [Planctomycetota bacterium]
LIHSAERSSSPELPTVVLCLTDRGQTSIIPVLLVHAAKQCTRRKSTYQCELLFLFDGYVISD